MEMQSLSQCDLQQAYGLIAVGGMDAKTFLQGQCTCDLNAIDETHNRYGAHCDPKGRMISNFRLFYYQDQYLLLLPKPLCHTLLAHLKKYAVFSKVTLDIVSDQFSIIGKYDPKGITCPSTETQRRGDGIEANCVGTPAFSHAIVAKKTEDIVQDTLTKTLWDEKTLSSFPWILPETSGHFTPNELGLLEIDAVSLKKGCYVGQEIIARMAYRGNLKKHLYTVKGNAQTTVGPGQSLWDGNARVCGEFVTIAPSSKDPKYFLAQAVIQDEAVLSDKLFSDALLQNKLQRV